MATIGPIRRSLRTSRKSTIPKARQMRRMMVRALAKPAARKSRLGALFDLRLFEVDVLARDWVVLAEAELLGLGPRILLGHIEEARVGAADELDLDGCRLGH